MGYVEATFPSGNTVRITNGIPVNLGRLHWCDGCESYEIAEFGREITDETGTIGILWMCGACLT